jgi:hypothetical protein
MKNGICPMCASNEVYRTENEDNLTAGSLALLTRFAADAPPVGRNQKYTSTNIQGVGKCKVACDPHVVSATNYQ